ncbi:MAG: FKBP-type peptidyl-prolyl cis-trans isomerase [Vicingaceae bacterium]|nr:FKBP-type peptidyl-prolyl cis-trans isomerase [Vicingaceae bacterium]
MRILSIIILLVFFSCSGSEDKNQIKLSPEELQEQLLEANKRALSLEKNQIQEYIKKKNIEVITTNTGLRYKIYEDVESDSILDGQVVKIDYSVELLDGTKCYNTEGKGEEFTVGKDYVESGLHEAVKYLSKGDKAIIIIPSHLGHGLTGDFEKIPIRSTIIYNIQILDVK